MAITVTLYTFAKRRNSTASPDGGGYTFTGNLKDPCSVLSPVVSFSGFTTVSPSSFNYAQIEAFGRYYYVTDWEFAGGLWWGYFHVDVLATYRAEIGRSTLYVARASEDFDGSIMDTLYPANNQRSHGTSAWANTANNPFQSSYYNGCYVVGVANGNYSSVGGICYYVLPQDAFNSLRAFLMADTDWTHIEDTNKDLGDNLYKSLFNPFQYISSIMWLPVGAGSISGGSTAVKIGWWDTGLYAYSLGVSTYTFSSVLTAYPHPEAYDRGVYLCSAPYTTYTLFAPPFGEFNLDANVIGSMFSRSGAPGMVAITVTIKLDPISGMGFMDVTAGSGVTTLVRASTTLGVPIHLAQITNNVLGAAGSVVGGVAGLAASASTGSLSGVIASLKTGISDTLENIVPKYQEKGSNGSIAPYGFGFKLESEFCGVVDDANADRGRPLCKEVQLFELYGGYIQTVGAHVDIAGFEEEITAINEFLDNGFFLTGGAG